MNMKEKFYATFGECLPNKEDGAEDLIKYLESTDFFTAPCSTMFHSNYEGGLADHSWNVYTLLKEKVARFNLDIPSRSVALCGLMHDICKTDFYVKEKKWLIDPKNPTTMKSMPIKDEDGKILKWEKQESKNWVCEDGWKTDDKFPIGHGEKSVIMLQKIIELTEEEIIAIRWHMMAFDAGIHFDYPNGFPFKTSQAKYPLVTLLATADMEASHVLEK